MPPAEAEAGRSAPPTGWTESAALAAVGTGGLVAGYGFQNTAGADSPAAEQAGGKRQPSLVTDASFGFINGCVGIPVMISFASITFRVSQG